MIPDSTAGCFQVLKGEILQSKLESIILLYSDVFKLQLLLTNIKMTAVAVSVTDVL